MQVQNSEIANIFKKVAELLEIKGDNPFRIRAYRNAAETLNNLPEKASDLVEEQQDLSELPDIGEDLAQKITEIVETGHLSLLDELEKKIPPIMRDLLHIKGIGPKRVHTIFTSLDILNLSDLKKAIESGKIRELDGFGEKTASLLLKGIEEQKIQSKNSRLMLAKVEPIAQDLLTYLKKAKGIDQLTIAGSYRRKKETVGDLDILITAKDSKAIIDYFVKYSEIEEVISHGTTRSTVILRTGLQVDLRAVANESYGAALLYFTGSKPHNIALRNRAIKQGMKINEYGIFKGDKSLASQTEEEIYRVLKLPYIEPELRENRGEIEAALAGDLPKLIETSDIMGDLHMHTKASDGHNTIRELVQAAKELGHSYIAITDHSKSLSIAHGLDRKRLLAQLEEIDQINAELSDFRVFKSMEVDILKDGSLDLSEDLLKKLDFTVCAIHSHFNLSEAEQTKRLLTAMKNPYFKILAHPTGRLINEREGYEVDMEKILKAAKKLKRVIEINAQPQRMDLPDNYCKRAKEMGVKMVISTDSHRHTQLEMIKYGVAVARRGWLAREDVINTMSLAEFEERMLTN